MNLRSLPLLLLLCAGCPYEPPPVGERISDPLDRLFSELDDDGSGALSLDELRCAEPDDLLARLDLDGDGAVSPDELRADLELWPEDLSRPARHGSPSPTRPGGPSPKRPRPAGPATGSR